MARHRKKIAVIVEQGPAVLDAPGPDQQVDGLADGDPAPAQRAEIAGSRDSDRLAGHWHDCEAAQQNLDFLSFPLAVQALQHLAKHQIPNDDLVHAKDRPQSPDMGRIAAIEKVDPDAAIDSNHPVPRPLRLRARLPRQRYLPNAASTSRCCRSLIIKRSACSTVCFLVACPQAFWASAISVSSISILVRIGVVPLLCVYLNDKIHTCLAQRPDCRMFTGETWSGHPTPIRVRPVPRPPWQLKRAASHCVGIHERGAGVASGANHAAERSRLRP